MHSRSALDPNRKEAISHFVELINKFKIKFQQNTLAENITSLIEEIDYLKFIDKQYDNPNPFGQSGPNPFGQQGFNFSFGPGGFNFQDIFSTFNQHAQQQQPRRGHLRMSLWLRLIDVAQGGRRPVALGNHTVEIDIPLGINDGDNVQYQGLAPGGQDLVIQFRIHQDPQWQRDGLNLITEIPVSVWDLIMGGDVTVYDILGNKMVTTVPARTQPRTMLRLRGQGLKDRSGAQGDILVRLHARIPDVIDPELLKAIEKHR